MAPKEMFYTGKYGQDQSPFMLNPQRPDDSNIASSKQPEKNEAEEQKKSETKELEKKETGEPEKNSKKESEEEDDDEPLEVTIAWLRADLNDLLCYIAAMATRVKRIEKRLPKVLNSMDQATETGKGESL